MKSIFYKHDDEDEIWWVRRQGQTVIGSLEFTFDKVKIYEFYHDYPENMTAEEVEIFKAENPTLAELR